ncbi:pentapeptide repeat-containing protein [Streptomyces sp. NPDC006617]|uniref:pentapeptide repeat-containing protein n=1 Tax=Streptomyces sp. NPDC006617 TaxID=3155354 RepID=UPI0033A95BCB
MKEKVERRTQVLRVLSRVSIGVFVVVILGGLGWFAVWGVWHVDEAHLRNKDGSLSTAAGAAVGGTRTAAVAAVAGLVAGISVYYTRKGHKQTEALFLHTREKDREQADLTREGQVTDRYVAAIKLLASQELTERVGGIYSLERIMRDSEKDARTVAEVLSTYVRKPANQKKEKKQPHARCRVHPQLKPDLQAALTVLARRPVFREELPLELNDVDVPHADLRFARLDNAVLRGARMPHVLLAGADLKDADLSGADLSGSNLTSAIMNGANLTGANLSGAILFGAHLDGQGPLGVVIRGTHKDSYVRFGKGSASDPVRGLTVEQVLKAKFDGTTCLPEDIASDPRIERRIASLG